MPNIQSSEDVSQSVKRLYNDFGWHQFNGVTYDAQKCEDLRSSAAGYVSACRGRVLRHLPPAGDRLIDMASGPIQYPEYLAYSVGFKTRVCIDLSQRALDAAKAKLGERGEYLCGDFLELDIAQGSVDAAVSLHTLYHIHASRQAEAVKKLLTVVKPGGNVVIVYSNPNNIISRFTSPLRKLARRTGSNDGEIPEGIYFKPYPLKWWKQFENVANVAIYPWRTFSTPAQKAIFPSGD